MRERARGNDPQQRACEETQHPRVARAGYTRFLCITGTGPDGWRPIYITQSGPVSPAPEPKRRVDITLRR